jgi:predicted DNA binding CopG/RHH family protein
MKVPARRHGLLRRRMKGEKNPYIKHLKQPVTIRLDKASVTYFKNLANELGMSYQNLINLSLPRCCRE